METWIVRQNGNAPVDASTYGAKMPRASWDFISLMFQPVPSTEEQTAIANFLDHETAKIDTLIAKQQELIKLLQEKQQAVISHAVTKGLNPDVPMKDSGVEWLGEVPEHWEVSRLKHFVTVQTGIAKGKSYGGQKTISIPYLRVANVQNGFLDLEDISTINILPSELNRYSLQYGDVLMNEGGDNDKLGRGAVWREELPICIHQNHVFAVRPITLESEWLNLITQSSYAKFYFFSVSKQSTNLASISSSNIKMLPMVIPPQTERRTIFFHLEEIISKIDNLMNRAHQATTLLKERRTALISAAVTGKIDVRSAGSDGTIQ